MWEMSDGAGEKILDSLSLKTYTDIVSQREEIIRAFIAKYEIEPDERMQVMGTNKDGKIVWYVTRKENYVR